VHSSSSPWSDVSLLTPTGSDCSTSDVTPSLSRAGKAKTGSGSSSILVSLRVSSFSAVRRVRESGKRGSLSPCRHRERRPVSAPIAASGTDAGLQERDRRCTRLPMAQGRSMGGSVRRSRAVSRGQAVRKEARPALVKHAPETLKLRSSGKAAAQKPRRKSE